VRSGVTVGNVEAQSLREALAARGFEITDEAVAAAGEELDRLRASFTPELERRAAEIREMIGRPSPSQ
jgi:hypothetical protein